MGWSAGQPVGRLLSQSDSRSKVLSASYWVGLSLIQQIGQLIGRLVGGSMGRWVGRLVSKTER